MFMLSDTNSWLKNAELSEGRQRSTALRANILIFEISIPRNWEQDKRLALMANHFHTRLSVRTR